MANKENKSSVVMVRLRPIDRNYLVNQSNKDGITMAEYVRRLLLEDSFKKKNNIQ